MIQRKPTVQIFKLGHEPRPRDYWLTRPMEERVMEVLRLRAIWGANKESMQRVVVSIRPLREPHRSSGSKGAGTATENCKITQAESL